MCIVIVVKLAAVKVKSLDQIKVEKEKPAVVDEQKDNEVSMHSSCTCMYTVETVSVDT